MKAVDRALHPSRELYASISRHAVVEYEGDLSAIIMSLFCVMMPISSHLFLRVGVRVSSGRGGDSPWSPREITALPTADEFHSFVLAREPFVIRGSRVDGGLKMLLNWSTSLWLDPAYLLSKVDEEEEVLVERRKRRRGTDDIERRDNSHTDRVTERSLFGFGTAVHTAYTTLRSFLTSFFCVDEPPPNRSDGDSSDAVTCEANSEWVEYLNVQDFRHKDAGVWRPPLHIQGIRMDLPLPPMLKQYVDDGSMTDVNLWMGNSAQGINTHTLALHIALFQVSLSLLALVICQGVAPPRADCIWTPQIIFMP
jgi:hypothetical protein